MFSQQKDVKVGLVLSGGGAKGVAHVSAIKAIEKAGVRIDYIGGTSFGAMIGALYASGYTSDELDSIVRNTDFEKVISNVIERKNKPFQEKERTEKYILSLPLRKFQIGIPSAFSKGQGVSNLLTRLTKNVNHITDFSKLPIPFLCVATNLETGKQVVLKKGFLPQALRASGAFPTLIAPVMIDGKLLADGGIVNNFPVDEVKKMGADILIGVDIQSDLKTKKDLSSAVKILNQIVGFKMYEKKDEKINKVNILIKPDVGKFGVIDFDEIDFIMKKADSAAYSQFDKLKAIAKKQKSFKKIEKLPNVSNIYIKKIEVKGISSYTKNYVLGKLELKQGEIITYKKLTQSINKLSATNNFQRIQYKIKREPNGSILKLDLEETKDKTHLNLAIHYDKLYKMGVLLGLSSKSMLFKNDLFSLNTILGYNARYTLDYFIDNGANWSFGIKSIYNQFRNNAKFKESFLREITIHNHELNNQIYVQTFYKRRFALKAGLEHTHYNLYTNTISRVIEGDKQDVISNKNKPYLIEKSSYLKAFSEMTLDAYDKKYFPKKGVYFNAKGMLFLSAYDSKEVYNSENKKFNAFFQVYGKIGVATTYFSKLTSILESEIGLSIGNNDREILEYKLGGYGNLQAINMIPFYGYDYQSDLTAPSFLRTAITLRYEIFKKNYLSIAVNAARAEADLFNDGYIFSNTKIGYMAGYEVDSFLGPISVNATWSPQNGETHWYFSLGYWF